MLTLVSIKNVRSISLFYLFFKSFLPELKTLVLSSGRNELMIRDGFGDF